MGLVVDTLQELYNKKFQDGDIVYVTAEQEYFLYNENTDEWLVYIEDDF
jgi:hypothetical protein